MANGRLSGVRFEGLLAGAGVALAPVGHRGACLECFGGEQAYQPRRCAAGGNWLADGPKRAGAGAIAPANVFIFQKVPDTDSDWGHIFKF